MAKTKHIRAAITVSGDVQGVGYRYFVRRVAWKQGLKGTVENLEDGTVRIVCEGKEKAIDGFVDSIDVERPPINVEKISSDFSDATGEFIGFKIVPGSLEEEMIEGFSTGAAYFEVMFDKQDQALEKMDHSLEKQDLALGKTDQMLEKQDETVSVIRDESQKTRETVRDESQKTRDVLSTTIKDEGEKTRQEHIKTRNMSTEIFHSEVQELRQEINYLRSSIDEIRKKVGIA
jgi:acylphosphatase